jgi:hypothetical protein
MRAAAIALAALALTGCGHDSRTSLDVVFSVSGLSGFTRQHEHLSCDPPAGNVASPAASCMAIDRGKALLFSRESRTICIGGITFIDVEVEGTYEGETISRAFGHCGDGRVIDAWARALRVTVLDVAVSSGGRDRWVTLACDPPGGEVSDPLRACRSLERAPDLLRPPRRAGCDERSPSVSVAGLRLGERVVVDGRCAFARRWIETLLGFYTPPPERRS